MSKIFVGTCFDCEWFYCDFSVKDEKEVLIDAEKHFNETGHTVSVDSRKNVDADFKNIKTFERKE